MSILYTRLLCLISVDTLIYNDIKYLTDLGTIMFHFESKVFSSKVTF